MNRRGFLSSLIAAVVALVTPATAKRKRLVLTAEDGGWRYISLAGCRVFWSIEEAAAHLKAAREKSGWVYSWHSYGKPPQLSTGKTQWTWDDTKPTEPALE